MGAEEHSAQSESLLSEIARTYYDLLAAFEQHVGLSATRTRMLMLLREAELSQAELQRRLNVDGAVITRQVKQCEEDGQLLRRAAPHDNRFTLVSLTPQGRELAEQLATRRELFAAQAIAGLDPADLAATTRCLQRLRTNMKELC